MSRTHEAPCETYTVQFPWHGPAFHYAYNGFVIHYNSYFACMVPADAGPDTEGLNVMHALGQRLGTGTSSHWLCDLYGLNEAQPLDTACIVGSAYWLERLIDALWEEWRKGLTAPPDGGIVIPAEGSHVRS